MRNKAVDQYISKAPEFARPILERIRGAYAKASGEIEETIKWGVPFFEYKGILGQMAAFKKHASYGFWNARLMEDSKKIMPPHEPPGMGGARVTDVSQLPAERVLVAYVKEAMALNDVGVKRPPRKKAVALKVPKELTAALKGNKKAGETFKKLSVSCRNEYVEWIGEAKQPATRERRLATTIQWLEEGKSRNWKYEGK